MAFLLVQSYYLFCEVIRLFGTNLYLCCTILESG
jgi:hypothetical protein